MSLLLRIVHAFSNISEDFMKQKSLNDTQKSISYKKLAPSSRTDLKGSNCFNTFLHCISYPFEPQDNSSCIPADISLAYTCHG